MGDMRMTWDESIPMQVQIAENFVEEASGYSSEREFIAALYREMMVARRIQRERERSQRRRDIARGMRGFIIEEVRCKGCGKPFGRLKGTCGRPKVYCSEKCESTATTRKWRRG